MRRFLLATILALALLAPFHSQATRASDDMYIDCTGLCAAGVLAGYAAFNATRDSEGCSDADCTNAVAEGISARYTFWNSQAPSCNCHE